MYQVAHLRLVYFTVIVDFFFKKRSGGRVKKGRLICPRGSSSIFFYVVKSNYSSPLTGHSTKKSTTMDQSVVLPGACVPSY